MKTITSILLLLILSFNTYSQIGYNKYTVYNPYYGKSQTYKESNPDNEGKDMRFELGVIIMGVGLVTMLAATHMNSTSYNSGYSSYYSRESNFPVFFTGVGLTLTGLTISLLNTRNRSSKKKEYYYED
ncbi:hypothetical protein COB55_03905 [Candidatus Wolfebacteria bacterium]|nr:MAG: hypothetical protein COB55_03905 [Candidatus Wolfebacteria bacterium]